LCAGEQVSDTVIEVLNPDLSLLLTDDDGADSGRCSLATTDVLPPARHVFCVFGYNGEAVDATVEVRIGEQFADDGGACLRASVLRGCDPAAIDRNADGVTDVLKCASHVCEIIYRVGEGQSCLSDVDVCETDACLLFLGEEQPRCGAIQPLDEGDVCGPEYTGSVCDGGTRCRADEGAFRCQDCVEVGVAPPRLFCGVPRTYEQAEARCAEDGMRLLSVVDRGEDVNVFDRAELEFGYEGLYWLGLTDVDQEGLYRWVDGRTWVLNAVTPYSDWAENEPTNIDEQDCIGTDDDGNWADELCTALRATICEAP
jgi:hypothetical protein